MGSLGIAKSIRNSAPDIDLIAGLIAKKRQQETRRKQIESLSGMLQGNEPDDKNFIIKYGEMMNQNPDEIIGAMNTAKEAKRKRELTDAQIRNYGEPNRSGGEDFDTWWKKTQARDSLKDTPEEKFNQHKREKEFDKSLEEPQDKKDARIERKTNLQRKEELTDQATRLGQTLTKNDMNAKTKGLFDSEAYQVARQQTLDQLDELDNQIRNLDRKVGGTWSKGETKQTAQQDKYEVGKTYIDANGNKAKYIGNGQWQEQK